MRPKYDATGVCSVAWVLDELTLRHTEGVYLKLCLERRRRSIVDVEGQLPSWKRLLPTSRAALIFG